MCSIQQTYNQLKSAMPLLPCKINTLFQPGSYHGPDLSLDGFCTLYNLSEGIQTRLHENGYMSAETLMFIVVPELWEMGFKFREIAAMKAAMKHWSQ
jgi:hypothetical protein